jgi:hypothetical protein
MRHTQLRLRADNEPALTTVVEAVNAVWPHFVRVDQRPLYSSASEGRTGHSVGATAGSGLHGATVWMPVGHGHGHDTLAMVVPTCCVEPQQVPCQAGSQVRQSRYRREVVPFGETCSPLHGTHARASSQARRTASSEDGGQKRVMNTLFRRRQGCIAAAQSAGCSGRTGSYCWG